MLPGIIDRIQSQLDKINTSITPGELEEIRKIVTIDESIDGMTEVEKYYYFIIISLFLLFFSFLLCYYFIINGKTIIILLISIYFQTLFRPNRRYIREGNLVLKRKGASSLRVQAKTTSLAFFKKKQQLAPMWFLFNGN